MSLAVEVRERPILFSGPMVRALLDGSKTQTRRVVTDRNSLGNAKASQLDLSRAWVDAGPSPAGNTGPYLKSYLAADFAEKNGWPKDSIIERLYPRWEVGDRLWVRETWAALSYDYDYDWGACDGWEGCDPVSVRIWRDRPESKWDRKPPCGIVYAAGGQWEAHKDDRGFVWRPSIHMPRWASRITLELTEVRVQRVQEISEDDARAEGVRPSDAAAIFQVQADGEQAKHAPEMENTARGAFACLWDSINAVRGYSWASNPYVWALSFRVVTP